eukprot:scaffold421_cov125-Isochrysis_galbana.AAC.8
MYTALVRSSSAPRVRAPPSGLEPRGLDESVGPRRISAGADQRQRHPNERTSLGEDQRGAQPLRDPPCAPQLSSVVRRVRTIPIPLASAHHLLRSSSGP